MPLESIGSNINEGPSLKESPEYLKKLDERVKKIEQDEAHYKQLIKVNDVLNVLDFPDNLEETFRKILLKQNNKTLAELAKKSKKDIIIFLTQENNEEKNLENQKNNNKLNRLKSIFNPQILKNNPDIANSFEALELAQTPEQKEAILQGILKLLKEPGRLKSIIDSLGGADKNNSKYVEFKNSLVGVDSSFETYFNDLEKLEAGISLNANKVIQGIEKDSGGMIDIDLKANVSKLSLEGSSYSFDKNLDSEKLNAVEKIKNHKEEELKRSYASLKGLYKPFASLSSKIEQNLSQQNSKESSHDLLSSFPNDIFSEMDDVYETMNIDSNIQITKSDMNSLAESKTIEEFRVKKENIETKFQKIANEIKIQKEGVETEYKSSLEKLATRGTEAKEKQVEVLKFFKNSGFDLFPKELTDKVINMLQSGMLIVPGLDLNIQNMDLENGHFGESSAFLDKDSGINTLAKRNIVKFMNKMISGDTTEPLGVEAIINGVSVANPAKLKNDFLKADIVGGLGWKYSKILENLRKKV